MPCVGTKPSWRAAVASRQPATRTAPSRSSAGRHASQSAKGRRGWQVRPARYASIARGSAPAARSASASIAGSRLVRVAWKNARYGCWVGCAKRRRNGVTRIDGAALSDREGVPPEPQGVPEADRGGGQCVRPLPRQSEGRPRDPDAHGVERLVEAGALGLHPAQERLGVGDRRRPAEHGGRRELERQRRQHPHPQRAREQGERARQARRRDALDRRRVGTGSRAALRRAAAGRAPATRRSAGRAGRARARARGPAPSPGRGGSRAASRLPRLAASRRRRPRGTLPARRAGRSRPPRPSTIASASTTVRLIASGTPACSPTSTSSGSSASCTTTSPRKRRENSGVPRLSTTRRPGRRDSPPATRIVCRSVGTPIRSSSSDAATSAACLGSCGEPGTGSPGGSTTIVDAPAARNQCLQRRRRRAGSGARRARPRRRRRSCGRAEAAARSRRRPRRHPRPRAASRTTAGPGASGRDDSVAPCPRRR